MSDLPLDEDWSLSELEDAASRRVTDAIWSYVQGGAGEERTVRANLDAFRRRYLRPRSLVDRSEVDLRRRFLGEKASVPFFAAPTAYQGQVHPEGEVGLARALGAGGVLGVYSTLSSNSLEEIAHASGQGPRWFQLYLQPDPGVTRSLVERAERSGYSAIVLTVDAPVLGVRDRQQRGGFAIDASVPVGNGRDVVPPPRTPLHQGPTYRLRSESSATWEVLSELRSVTRLPLVVKGILSGDDARLAVEHGAQGIVVSNHGGRQLDGARSSLDALAEVVSEVGPRAEVYLDGGVRRGSDVLIALASGAHAVGIGRPFLWALATAGERGVRRYTDLLATELATAMALVGRAAVETIDSSLVGSY